MTLERWAPWWGLLVVPSTFLANLSVAYAVVPFACMTQRHGLLHVAPAVGLAITLVGLALSLWSLARLRDAEGQPVRVARRFLAGMSLALVMLFLLATLTQWYAIFKLSPCVQ